MIRFQPERHTLYTQCQETPVLEKLFNGGFHDSAHVRESNFFSSPLHAVARAQATSFNCIVNEPIGRELIARV